MSTILQTAVACRLFAHVELRHKNEPSTIHVRCWVHKNNHAPCRSKSVPHSALLLNKFNESVQVSKSERGHRGTFSLSSKETITFVDHAIGRECHAFIVVRMEVAEHPIIKCFCVRQKSGPTCMKRSLYRVHVPPPDKKRKRGLDSCLFDYDADDNEAVIPLWATQHLRPINSDSSPSLSLSSGNDNTGNGDIDNRTIHHSNSTHSHYYPMNENINDHPSPFDDSPFLTEIGIDESLPVYHSSSDESKTPPPPIDSGKTERANANETVNEVRLDLTMLPIPFLESIVNAFGSHLNINIRYLLNDTSLDYHYLYRSEGHRIFISRIKNIPLDLMVPLESLPTSGRALLPEHESLVNQMIHEDLEAIQQEGCIQCKPIRPSEYVLKQRFPCPVNSVVKYGIVVVVIDIDSTQLLTTANRRSICQGMLFAASKLYLYKNLPKELLRDYEPLLLKSFGML